MSSLDLGSGCGSDHVVEHDWRSWQRVGLIILRSWVRSPHCALREFETNFQIMNGSVMSAVSTIGAAGSASVLCTGGPGFDPLIVHDDDRRVSLVGQDSWLSPGRHGFDSRTGNAPPFGLGQTRALPI